MATYYISPTGNDSTGLGTLASPWATISKAHTSASSGDTVICLAGTYAWVAQTFTKSLTIQGATGDPEDVIFDASNANIGWAISGASLTISFLYLKFVNLGITSFVNLPVGFSSNSTGSTFNATDCIWLNIQVVSSNATTGVGGFLGCNDTTTASVSANLTRCVVGIKKYASATRGAAFSADVGALNLTINNCSFYLFGVSTEALTSILVTRNATGTFTVKNSIFYAITSTAWGNVLTTNNLTYSCFYNITSPPTYGTGVITSDPLFVDAANGNFNLRPASPCINTGILV